MCRRGIPPKWLPLIARRNTNLSQFAHTHTKWNVQISAIKLIVRCWHSAKMGSFDREAHPMDPSRMAIFQAYESRDWNVVYLRIYADAHLSHLNSLEDMPSNPLPVCHRFDAFCIFHGRASHPIPGDTSSTWYGPSQSPWIDLVSGLVEFSVDFDALCTDWVTFGSKSCNFHVFFVFFLERNWIVYVPIPNGKLSSPNKLSHILTDITL